MWTWLVHPGQTAVRLCCVHLPKATLHLTKCPQAATTASYVTSKAIWLFRISAERKLNRTKLMLHVPLCGRQYCRTTHHPLLDHSRCHDEALWMAYIHRGTCRDGPTPFLFTRSRAAITSSTLSIPLLDCRRWRSFKEAVRKCSFQSSPPDSEIESEIKAWLRNSRDRAGERSTTTVC
ncbi:hypothetical protein DPEC_G00247510 [Dallia pectoralis]|uniref:Uncharacterized protein n=1 Tax=Dallia pectoralis TaxID=75939 RepID=A0ACC2FWC8_DALPE|nr:hypothetical protein DPEC_G00247510 [Dallia pectoralis]